MDVECLFRRVEYMEVDENQKFFIDEDIVYDLFLERISLMETICYSSP